MPSRLSEADGKMLKLLLDSEGRVSSNELSGQLKVPIDSVGVQRKMLEETYLVKQYSIDPTKFGWRRIDLLIYTDGGLTMRIGKELLKRKEVMCVTRMIGEHTIDLRVEVLVKDNRMLLNLIEEIKTMKGVRDVVWTEVVETIGRKNLSNYFSV
jgi:DNA-binding Lrp family transcriptional regulator